MSILSNVMNKNKTMWIVSLACWYCSAFAQQEDSIPNEAKTLMLSYPAQIVGFSDNYVLFNDSSRLLFDDGKQKTTEQLLNNPDIQDMFIYSYPKGKLDSLITKNYNPGRIRNDDFFKKIYGKTEEEVKKNLVEIVWCPKLVGQKLKITSVNGVDKRLAAVSAELDEHPEWKDYLKSAGSFYWRSVRGSNRLSAHSFGIAIDLNTKYSNYWQWDCKCTSENVDLIYKNKIPYEIVAVFEKYGFIWGGKWYHYDTMHFEYRPELLLDIDALQNELSPEELAMFQSLMETPKEVLPISASKGNNLHLILLFIIVAIVLIGGLLVLKWDVIKSWFEKRKITKQIGTSASESVTAHDIADNKRDTLNNIEVTLDFLNIADGKIEAKIHLLGNSIDSLSGTIDGLVVNLKIDNATELCNGLYTGILQNSSSIFSSIMCRKDDGAEFV